MSSRVTVSPRSDELVLALSTDYASTSYPALTPLAVAPSGNGVVDLRPAVPQNILLFPFGEGGNGKTFNMRLIGWKSYGGSQFWVPVDLWEGVVTLGTLVGLSGSVVDNNHTFGTSISTTIGNNGTDCEVISPANNLPAHVIVQTKGALLVQVCFQLTNAQATAANALVGLN